MNDFQMSSLAAGHVGELRAEAARHHLAQSGKRQSESAIAGHARRSRRFIPGSLMRRAVA